MYGLTKGIRAALPLSLLLLLLLVTLRVTSAMKLLPLDVDVNLEPAPVPASASAPADETEYYGLTFPPNVTRGVPFTLSYRLRNELSGPTFSFAHYGMDLTSLARYPSLGLPAFVSTDGSADTSSSLLSRTTGGTFNLTLCMPKLEEDGMSEYLSGETTFAMALFGTVGGRMDPLVMWVNQTTFVLPGA